MLNSLRPKPPFQKLIVSEQKSLGRESSETPYWIKQLALAGVEIVEYVHGRTLNPKNWLDKMTSTVLACVDEGHRQQSGERVHESHLHKVKRGHHVGGRVFGYRNVHRYQGVDRDGNPLRTHTVLEKNEEEAAVVRRIFELYASGVGLKGIAKQLTSEKALAPQPFKRKDGLSPALGWSPSTIRAILTRDLYRGVKYWNRSRKRNEWGKVDQRPRPAEDVVTVTLEHLRIVSDELWQRVASRRRDVEGRAVRFSSGRLSGRPPKHATRNLLAGLATCGVCGGGLVVETSGCKQGRIPQYVCHRHRHNGTCSNALRVSVVEMNEAVLRAIEEHALTPEAVEHVVRLTERDDLQERQLTLNRDGKDIDTRIGRLVVAIEQGGHAPSLVAKLRELEARKQQITSDLASLRPVPRLRGPAGRVAPAATPVDDAGARRAATCVAGTSNVHAASKWRRL